MSEPSASPSGQTALKTIIVLLTVIAGLAFALVWLWRHPRTPDGRVGLVIQVQTPGNLIKQSYPDVDFTTIYPGMTAAEIDRLQRACIGLRYVYAPYVEFAPLPVRGPYVNITPAGFRQGRDSAAPWPPAPGDLVVFVFGGSTTFGYGLPDDQTVVSALEEALSRHYPARKVRCYNFGRGYYFSTQERKLFETLLEQGRTPDLALFIDGLNEFAYPEGRPQLTPALYGYTAPDLPVPAAPALANDADRAAAVAGIIQRYWHHIRLTKAMAQAYGVNALFVGQPAPFLDYGPAPADYPFHTTFAEHRLGQWGYGRFKQAAQDGLFGDRFVWCGDAFAGAKGCMYVDSLHYSQAGAKRLAEAIVARTAQAGLLP